MKIALCAAAIALLSTSVLASAAKAGYIVDLTQQGSNVVASGSGAIDLTGLSFELSFSNVAFIHPSTALIYTGPAFPDFLAVDEYTGIAGPTSFGSGDTSFPSSGSGDLVGIEIGASNVDALFVPTGYVSGDPLSDTTTYTGKTFSTLGVTPGVYKWTWGTGINQNFTLDIGTAAVPEPPTWAMLLAGFAGLGFLGYRKTRRDNALA